LKIFSLTEKIFIIEFGNGDEIQSIFNMLHPDTTLKFVNHIIGSGVFATEFIPKGTLTYVKDSLEIEISPEQISQHPKAMQGVIDKYSYIDENGRYIISWDNAKYINHCCEPNSISTGYGFEIAIKDIYPDDEITDDYGLFNLEQGFQCECGSPKCRKRILPEDLDNLSSQWDELVLPALQQFEKVTQPLAQFLDEQTADELKAYLKGKSAYKSVQNLRLAKEKLFVKR
jgi:uncharacterized protein